MEGEKILHWLSKYNKVLESWKFWVCLAIFRILLSFTARHYYHADEFYQSQQVAYDLVYGGVELPWEWKVPRPIRSTVFPAIYAAFYKLAASLHIDSRFVLVNLGYLVQSMLFFICDICEFTLARKLLPKQEAFFAFVFYITNSMMNETMAKTFSNNMETILLMLGLILYLYRERSALYDHLIPVCLVLSVTLRCTSAIGWCFLVICHLYCRKNIILIYLYVGIPCFYLMMLPDYLYYGKWHLLPLNFIMFNVIEGKSEIFGTSPIYAYVEAYIPDHMGLLYPIVIFGCVIFAMRHKEDKNIAVPLTLGVNLLVYSLAGHKETRFLMHIVPLLLLMGGCGFGTLLNSKRLRYVLKVGFWLIIWLNVLLYILKVGGRPHTSRIYDRLLEVHNVSKPGAIGIYADCFLAPHNIQLHATNLTLRTSDCMPMITRDDVQTVMHPFSELHADYLDKFETKTPFERLSYIMLNQELSSYENIYQVATHDYDLIGIVVTGRKFEYPLRPPYWTEAIAGLSEYYKMYIFKIRS